MKKNFLLLMFMAFLVGCAPNTNTLYHRYYYPSNAFNLPLEPTKTIYVSHRLNLNSDIQEFINEIEAKGYVFLGHSEWVSEKYDNLNHLLEQAKNVNAVLVYTGGKFASSETRTGSYTTTTAVTTKTTSNTTANTNINIIGNGGFASGYGTTNATTNTTSTTYIPTINYYKYEVNKFIYLTLFFGQPHNKDRK